MRFTTKALVFFLSSLLVVTGIPLLGGGAATAQDAVESFALPFGVQYEKSTGYVYVADSVRNCLVRTKIDGSGWLTFGSEGSGRNRFLGPKGLYLDGSGYLYVSDAGNNRIVKTRMDGSGWTTLGGVRGMGTGQFAGPRGIVVDESTGYIYVADSGNNRIVKTRIDGSGWTTWGTQGTGTGEFYLPTGVDYDPATGYLYVSDAGNCRVVRGKMDGSGWKTLGSLGGGAENFRYPRGIISEGGGSILVVDTGNCRLVKTDINGTTWEVLGTRGYGTGNFRGPRSVDGDTGGDLFVADGLNHRVARTRMDGSGWTSLSAMYSADFGISCIEPPGGAPGDDVTIFGVGFGATQGDGAVEFNGETAEVASWSDTEIGAVVPEAATTGDVRVVKGSEQTNGIFFPVVGLGSLFKAPFGVTYDADTEKLCVSDTRHNRLVQVTMEGEELATVGSPGFGDLQFARPTGLHYPGEEDGYFYTADAVNNRVVRTDIEGDGWLTLGTQGPGDGELYFPRNVFYDAGSGYLYVADAGNNRVVKTTLDSGDWTALGTHGAGSGQFAEPRGITCDPDSDLIYVVDSSNHRIVRTSIDGSGWSTMGAYGGGEGQFRFPRSIYLDQPTGDLYIADTDNHRIVRTAFDGSGWTSLGTLGSGEGQFYYPRGIWLDAESGLVYVADSGNNRIVSTMMDGTGWSTLEGGPDIPFRWNLAEGTTRTGFDQYLCLLNPGDDTARVSIQAMLPAGGGDTHEIEVAPNTRVTLSARELAAGEQDVAFQIESNRPLIAERPMYFDREAFNGGHDNVGQPDPSTTFYFAEGTTRRGFQEWLTVQNPGGQTAHVELSFMMDGGDNREMELTLAPHSRSTVKVIDIVGADRDVAVALRSDAPVVAERPMYFLYHDKWSGGHVSSGLDSPGNRFYFAEGTTREGFEEWICLMNPGEADATVQVTYMMEDGSTTSDSVLVEARSRETVDVAARVGPGRDVSALVESDVPVVAERPMYFSYGEGMWDGGHNCPGVEQAKTSFYFAEGTTREGFDEWITVMNPGEEAATVRITYMFGEGQGQALTREMAVGPHARATVDVAAETGRGKDVSVKLESSAPVLAERPMYFDYHGEAVGGDCSIGYGI